MEARGGGRERVGVGRKMTQTMYAHMNKGIKILKKITLSYWS
jgi:hypothetical protein